MAMRSGLAAQFGMVDEVTYGTRVAPTRFLEFSEESIELNTERIEAFGLRASSGGASGTTQRSDRYAANKKGGSGSISFSGSGDAASGVQTKGFGLLFKHIFGAAATITTPGGGTNSRNHKHVLGDPGALSFTAQIGVPDNSGTVRVKEAEGCMVTKAEFSQGVDEWLGLSVDVDCEDVTMGSASLASASYTTGAEGFHYGQCTVTVGGSSVDVISYKLSIENPLKTDRYFVKSSTLKSQPQLNGKRMITGELEMEWDGLTQFNRYYNNTTAAVIATWTTTTAIEASIFPKLILTCNTCRFDKPSGPNVSGPDMVTYTLPFVALYDGTNETVQLDYVTSDTTS